MATRTYHEGRNDAVTIILQRLRRTYRNLSRTIGRNAGSTLAIKAEINWILNMPERARKVKGGL